jgi:hypothetical protein
VSNSSVRIAPCGSWKSPITSARIVEFSIGLSEVRFDGDDVCWVEQRLTENRYAVVRRSASGTSVLPGPYSARTRVHEYLGGAWSVLNGALYFSNDPPGSRCWHTGANHSLGATGNRAAVCRRHHRLRAQSLDWDSRRAHERPSEGRGGASGEHDCRSGSEAPSPTPERSWMISFHRLACLRMDTGLPGLHGITHQCPGPAPSSIWPSWERTVR